MYLLVIDEGTSSTRAMIYSVQGQLICKSQYTITSYFPKPGWVEQDPEEIWQKTLLAICDVVAQVPINKVIACGLTNQRETTLIWDKRTGHCLTPAIGWQDRRTEAFCTSLTPHRDMIRAKTGLLPDPYFCASKLHWMLTQIPEASALAAAGHLAFGTIDSFLLWRLTQGVSHVTDITNASRTLLFNIHQQSWDDELLQLFAIPKTILPTVCDSDAHFGMIHKDILGREIPITGVAGDQQASLIGHQCFTPGMVKATFGTGGFLLLNTGSTPIISKHHLLTTIAYRMCGTTIYGLEGSMYHAGSTIKWLRDELQLFTTAEDSEILAQSLPGNDGVYLVPSFTGLGAPHWLTKSGAFIVGLSQTTTRAHFARAALECVAYQTRDILTCMREASNLPLSVLRVDGGMSLNQWMLQFLSSLNNVLVERSTEIETTALGAMILTSIGCGAIDSLSALQVRDTVIHSYVPSTDRSLFDVEYQKWLSVIQMIGAS